MKESSRPTAIKLRELISRCPICGDLSKHHFAQIASTVATEANEHRVQELIANVKEHRWAALAEYDDFRPDENDVVVYSITGPHSGGIAVLIRDPFDLYEPAELYLQEQSTEDEISGLAALATAREWQDF